jgi:hypothetical protein
VRMSTDGSFAGVGAVIMSSYFTTLTQGNAGQKTVKTRISPTSLVVSMQDAMACRKFSRCMSHKIGCLSFSLDKASELENLPYPSKDIFCQNCATDPEIGYNASPFGYVITLGAINLARSNNCLKPVKWSAHQKQGFFPQDVAKANPWFWMVSPRNPAMVATQHRRHGLGGLAASQAN